MPGPQPHPPLSPRRAAARIKRAAATLAAACLCGLPYGGPAHGQASEYQVKAAFLYNFARFVEWPDPAGGTRAIVLCILGDDPFGRDIDALVGKQIDSRTLQVRRLASADGAAACQMLFIAGSESANLGRALNTVKGRAVLTISDTPGYSERGTVINLYVEQSKVRFEINIDAAKRTPLTISSQLLKLARITHDRGGNG